MSFTVSRRSREIGIRVALGAGPRRILWAILSRAFMQVGLGVVAGSLPVILLNVFTASKPNLGLLLMVAAIMTEVGLLACGMPARRALRIVPH